MNENRRRPPLPQWRRVVLTTTGVLAAAAATTFVVRSGVAATVSQDSGDSGGPQPTRTVVATPGPTAVTAPHARPETPSLVIQPSAAATPLAQPVVDPRLVVYTIAGNQRPNDPITVVYADETGALRTAENVSLPWQLTVIPEMPVNYVTANSAGSQLNCWITDATGATVAAQTDNGISATCNR